MSKNDITITFRLPADVNELLTSLASKSDRTKSNLIRFILCEWMQAEKDRLGIIERK